METNRNLKILIVFCCFVLVNGAQAQNFTDEFTIRDYNSNELLSFHSGIANRTVLSPYGNLLSRSTQSNDENPYLFQGQEYDLQLGLYFFPARMYSSKTRRFLTADPKSQYHSPYSFVGGDPVNLVDRDGRDGKALVLYGEDHTEPFDSGDNAAIHDLESEVGDAHFVPMSDFLNGEVVDLPEWNGNVFIQTHTAESGPYSVQIENADHIDDIRTSSKSSAEVFQLEPEEIKAYVKPEDLGRKLRSFADEKNVSVKNITVGGCQGEDAAQRIGQGYIEGGSGLQGKSLTTQGIKKGRYSSITGKYGTFKDEEVIFPLERTRFDISPKEASPRLQVEEEEEGGYRATGIDFQMPDGTAAEVNTAQGGELNELVNGRVPDSLSPGYKTFKLDY